MTTKNTAILLISCPDQKGLVAGIADFLYQHNANILHADQHQDAELKLFLMRVEWELAGFDLMITTDQGIRYQQNLTGRTMALLVLDTNDWPRIRGSKALVVNAVSSIQRGAYVEVAIPFA